MMTELPAEEILWQAEGKAARYRLSSWEIGQLVFQVQAARQLAVALAADPFEDSRRLQDFIGSPAAGSLFLETVPKPNPQAIRTTEGVSLQLFGDAVAPAGGNLEGRQGTAVARVTADGIGGNHGSIRNQRGQAPLTKRKEGLLVAISFISSSIQFVNMFAPMGWVADQTALARVDDQIQVFQGYLAN
jgi:hypothetical protein